MAKTELSGADYEKLGRQVGELLRAEHDSMPRTGVRHFVNGIFSGLGGVVGATAGIAILIWLLHSLGGLPVVGNYLNNVSQSIQTQKK